VIIIASLAFDTFSQQVLAIDFRLVADKNNASAVIPAPRSENYAGNHPGFGENVFQTSWVEMPLVGNIYQGIFGDNVNTLQATYATGNCDYPITPTLGVCGGCTDVTKSLKSSNCPGPTCIHSLGAGFKVNGTMNLGLESTTVFDMQSFSGDVYKNTYSGTVMQGGPNEPIYILNFQALGTINQSLDPSHMAATECALWICVQGYNVSVRSGRQQQVALPLQSYPVVQTPDNYSLAITDLAPEFNTLPNTSFAISTFPIQGLPELLKNNLFQSCLVLSQNMPKGIGAAPQVTFYANDGVSHSNANIVQVVWAQNGRLDTWIQNLAKSISNYFRLSSPATNDSAHYTGTAYSTQPFVRVRWPWLTFPVAMVLASLLFFVATVWRTQRSSVRPWKTSALALLMIDVDDELKVVAEGSLDDREGPVARIGEREVLLRERGGD
jgi:hypothetical protein